jgi:hypothetical protein
MWDQTSLNEPVVYRLDQRCGPVLERMVKQTDGDWSFTLADCQTMLTRLLPRLRSDRAGYWNYWQWVGRTRAEMSRIYHAHREECQLRRNWDLAALLRLRWRLELVTLRLYCAPLMPGGAKSPLLGLDQFSRLTA